MSKRQVITILMADDDDDDFLLTKKALAESKLANKLVRVEDGEELLEYLRAEGKYEGVETERPGMILLDLNMPRKDGRETLKELKADPMLRDIPVVVFTTSKTDEDVVRSYQLGSNSFISKPVTFEKLVKVVSALGVYWFTIVKLPQPSEK
jgi:CheY-like chemotaxis protein